MILGEYDQQFLETIVLAHWGLDISILGEDDQQLLETIVLTHWGLDISILGEYDQQYVSVSVETLNFSQYIFRGQWSTAITCTCIMKLTSTIFIHTK